MADAVKAVGKDVQQKATDELVDLEPHDLALPAAAIVLIGEGDVLIGDLDEPRVGDRRAMGVAREIAENLLGPAEGRLGVDDPVDLSQRGEAQGERLRLREGGEPVAELQLAAPEGGLQARRS